MPYRVIVADPPWAFRDRLPGGGRGAAKHYETMSTAAIAQYLPDRESNGQIRVALDAVLLMWRVSAMGAGSLQSHRRMLA